MDFPTGWNPDSGQSLAEFFATGRRAMAAKGKRARVDVYRIDAVIDRRGWTPACAGTVSERGKIGNVPSSRSLQNLIFRLNNCDVPMRSMLTLTMTPLCHNLVPPAVHRKAFRNNALQRLRDMKVRDWLWVREFQGNGSVHWHVFTALDVGAPGQVNEDLSHDWSIWWSALYWDRLITSPANKDHAKRRKISRARMERGNFKKFKGCCRWEQLKTEAAGRYAAKEGAKRFQKKAVGEWEHEGGAWWRSNKGMTCTPIRQEYVYTKDLASRTVDLPDGKQIDVAYKLQQSLGLKLLTRSQRRKNRRTAQQSDR